MATEPTMPTDGPGTDDLPTRLALTERAVAHREVIAQQARVDLASAQRQLDAIRAELARERVRAASAVGESVVLRAEIVRLGDELRAANAQLDQVVRRRGYRVVDGLARSIRGRPLVGWNVRSPQPDPDRPGDSL